MSYGMISILVISRCAAPPYPAAPDFPPSGGQNKTPRDNLLINPPLEMTMLAGPPLVISTEAGQPPIGKPLIVQARGQLRLTWRLYAESPQSGEISPSDGTGGITAGDLSTQSIIGAFSICLPYRHAAPLEMTVAAGAAVVQKGCIAFVQGAGRKVLMFKKAIKKELPKEFSFFILIRMRSSVRRPRCRRDLRCCRMLWLRSCSKRPVLRSSGVLRLRGLPRNEHRSFYRSHTAAGR